MANSEFEVVKLFEKENYLLEDCYIVVRVDGRGFHKFSANYKFQKPNDLRALELMNRAAKSVMEGISDILVSYGDSDEYSFLFRKKTDLFERREAKLVSTVVSTFTSYYQFHWSTYFPDHPLNLAEGLPTFDGRAVLYPNVHRIRSYFSWRQVDCHINNLYNTTFWSLVLKGKLTPQEAEEKLKGTLAKDKNEILFSEFGINYNNEPEIYKKGTVIVREPEDLSKAVDQLSVSEDTLTSRQKQRLEKKRRKMRIVEYHVDIIKDGFWDKRPWLLE